jgi:hypothetical protein
VRPGIDANDLLRTVASLCHGPKGEEPAYARGMVDLLIDGLRYRSKQARSTPVTDVE